MYFMTTPSLFNIMFERFFIDTIEFTTKLKCFCSFCLFNSFFSLFMSSEFSFDKTETEKIVNKTTSEIERFS